MYTAQAVRSDFGVGNTRVFTDEWDAIDFGRDMFLNDYDVTIFAPPVERRGFTEFHDSHICPRCGSWNDGHFAKRWACETCADVEWVAAGSIVNGTLGRVVNA